MHLPSPQLSDKRQGWTPRYMPGLNVKAATDREVVPGQDSELRAATPPAVSCAAPCPHPMPWPAAACPRTMMPGSSTFAVLSDAVDLSSNATTYVCSIRILAKAGCYAEPVHRHGLMCHGDPSQRQDGVLSSMFALAEASLFTLVLYSLMSPFGECRRASRGHHRRSEEERLKDGGLLAADWAWEPSQAHGTLVVGSGLALKELRRTLQPHLLSHVPCRECGRVAGPLLADLAAFSMAIHVSSPKLAPRTKTPLLDDSTFDRRSACTSPATDDAT